MNKGVESMKNANITNLYSNNVAIVKDYGIMKKLTLHSVLRKKGFEISKKYQAKGSVNDEKLEENIIRARSKIFELAFCNPWELFITLTIDGSKYDRYNLKRYHRDLAQWLRDYNKKYSIKIKYLLIPEMHEDDAWHMHGFLMGLPIEHLEINDNGYLDWIAYKEKFGYCSIDRIRNHEAVAKYVTKYISKELADCVKELNAHMYYASQGLKRAVEIKRGMLLADSIPWDFKNEWVSVIWLDGCWTDEQLSSLVK